MPASTLDRVSVALSTTTVRINSSRAAGTTSGFIGPRCMRHCIDGDTPQSATMKPPRHGPPGPVETTEQIVERPVLEHQHHHVIDRGGLVVGSHKQVCP